MQNILNKKWNHLTAIKYIGSDNNYKQIWEFECDCGNKKKIILSDVKNNKTKSCGCSQFIRKKKHGLTGHKLYFIWNSIKYRCYNKKSKYYYNYGGRGITMYEEWKNDFKTFYDWSIKNGWKTGLEIDRRDNDLGYSPDNCRFVTNKINSNNKRNNRLIKFNSKIQTLAQWSEELNIKSDTLLYRLKHWTIKQALTTPIKKL